MEHPRKRGRWAVVALVAAVAVIAAACGSSDSSSSSGTDGTAGGPADLGSVTVAIGLDAGYAPLIVAVEKGFFADEGVQATTRQFASGVEAQNALLAGEIDITISSESFPVLAKAQGGAFHVMGEFNSAVKQLGLVATGDISSPQDLVGKTVGAVQGSASEYFMLRYFDTHGLSPDTVNVSYQQSADMIPVLQRGDIDAFFLWAPHPARAVDTVEGAKIIAFNGDDDVYTLIDFLLFSDNLYNDAPLSDASLRAIMAAEDYIEQNQAETVALLAEVLDLEEAAAEAQLVVWDNRVQITPDSLQAAKDTAAWLADGGRLQGTVDWNAFFSSDALKRVAADRVTLR